MSIHTADVVVIGAGIVGTACAWALAGEGLRVTVVESSCVAGGATAAGMGHVVLMDDSEAEFTLTRYSRRLWLDLKTELPPQAEFEQRGTLWVAADDEEMDAVRKKYHFYTARGASAEVLDPAALAEAEPNLRPGLAGGLLIPEDSVLYAPCAAQWMLARARDRGTSLRIGVPAVEIREGIVRLGDGSTLSAGVAINAAGASAGDLTPGIGVRSRKGHLAITGRYPRFLRRQLVELGYLKSSHGSAAESVAFNVQPRATGQILIGSSRQFGAEDPAVDHSILSRMLTRAVEYMPALGNLSVIRTWTGFRAATADRLPLIGPWPPVPGLFLATGHEGLGITTSLGTAALVTGQILGRAPAIAPDPYLPARVLAKLAHA